MQTATVKTYAKAIIFLSILGTLNAAYLTVLFAQETWGTAARSFCDVSSEVSCTAVMTSPYALFLGVPVCSIALLVSPALAGIGFAALKRRRTRNLFYSASILAAMGLMLNVVYIYNEVAHIKALCLLCIACTVVIALVLFASIRGYLQSKE